MRTAKYFLICLLSLAMLASCSDVAFSPVITGDMNEIPEVAEWMKGTWSGSVNESKSTDDPVTVTMKEDGKGFNLTDTSGDFDKIKSVVNPPAVYKINECILTIDYTDTTDDNTKYEGDLTLTKKSDTEIELVLKFTTTSADGTSEESTFSGTLTKN